MPFTDSDVDSVRNPGNGNRLTGVIAAPAELPAIVLAERAQCSVGHQDERMQPRRTRRHRRGDPGDGRERWIRYEPHPALEVHALEEPNGPIAGTHDRVSLFADGQASSWHGRHGDGAMRRRRVDRCIYHPPGGG